MAEGRRYALNAQLDIEQILQEAQHRWLRPAEICEILKNYQKFRIAPEPPNRPSSGSLFLFDRKVLRYFRKDGHNWRKKKDGKTVKEAHERLKAGSIDVLHCYYAHGEENENFQRRSYWMLEEELSHIVLVHYREVKVSKGMSFLTSINPTNTGKGIRSWNDHSFPGHSSTPHGNRTNYNRIREAELAVPDVQENEDVANSEVDSSLSSRFHSHDFQVSSQITDASLNSAQASEYEDAESAYNNQTSSGFHSLLESQQPLMQKVEDGFAAPYYPVSSSDNYQGQFSDPFETNTSINQGDRDKSMTSASLAYLSGRSLNLPSWDNVLENTSASYHLQPSMSTMPSSAMSMMHGQGNEMLNQVMGDGLGTRQEFGSNGGCQEAWQASGTDASHVSNWSMNQKLLMESAYNIPTRLNEANNVKLENPQELFTAPAEQITRPLQDDLVQVINAEGGTSLKSEFDNNLVAQGKADYSSLKQPHLDGLREGLKKLDSFDRWMSKELGDVDESHIQSSSGTYWEAVGNEDGVDDSSMGPQVQLDTYSLDPSLSQDQYFSIIDFRPNWAYAGSEIKVLITGRFLKSQQEVENCKWACMFGELEVPAEVIADGVLRCHTPVHKDGRVPFYVTCSNRLACSEVREFEFRACVSRNEDVANANIGPPSESVLLVRFAKLLSLGAPLSVPSNASDTTQLCCKISSLLKVEEIEWKEMLNSTLLEKFPTEKIKDQLIEKIFKEKLYYWLLQKIAEVGKGPSVLDEGGQGALHLAAALGYDWAIPPIIEAGVSINYRDSNGWTALHWAASYGRERTVGFLISRDAAAGALTDPTPKYPSGRTPADLASSNGHKGIAGYLAESALSSLLSSLKLKEKKEGDSGGSSELNAVLTVSERTATPLSDGDLPLKDSLAAVRNATQAAARIHQVFRVQSFQRKQLNEYGNDEFGISDEKALSLLAIKTNRAAQHDEPVHAAAIRIQNKFRSWKSRKDFLLIRQRIIKIQAHFRGHQVRKNYKKIIWSVGIVEKVILRWRRKGSGLRGFKPEMLTEGPSTQVTSSKEDDYDFLKEGRRQTEERLQKALARVKSMVQYPEARDQYRRLLNVVSEMQENKAVYDKVLNSSEEAADFDEDLVDIQALLEDDVLMSG